jgi:hypothetical protein
MRQRAEITFETAETVVVRNSGKFLLGFCPLCGEEAYMFPPETLAPMTASSEREIFRLLETGNIHFVEAQRIYACLGCYKNSFEEAQTVVQNPEALPAHPEIRKHRR